MAVSPPRPKGPHLNALRAFEAAARLGSFSAAADELSVTPGAVTQHIKSLEQWTESQLFDRNARGVELTPLAEELLPMFSLAFDQLGLAVHALRTKGAPSKVRIATLPAIAQLWLAPRLGRLRQSAPEVSVSVVAMETPPNLGREPFDVSLFFSSPPLEADEIELFQDRIFPVCAPGVADRISSPEDLAKETLLHDSAWASDWDTWLRSLPRKIHITSAGSMHSLFSVAVEEAKHGGGVLMAHEALVAPLLTSGDLIKLFDHDLVLNRCLVARVNSAFFRSQSYDAIRSVLMAEL